METRLNAAEPAQLETWALRVLDATSLEEVFGYLLEHSGTHFDGACVDGLIRYCRAYDCDCV